MKNITLIISLFTLFIITSIGASAYPFMEYGHDAQFNDTAEQGTDPLNYGWVDIYQGSEYSYSTDNPFNGTKSIKFPIGVVPAYIGQNLSAYENEGNYYFQFALYVNTSMSSGNFIVGLTSDSNSGYYGGLFIDSNANYQYVRHDVDSGTPQVSGVAKTDGWHIVLYNITNYNNIDVTVDNVNIGSWTLNGGGASGLTTIGADYRIAGVEGGVDIYFDDVHLWNATVGEAPPASSAVNYTVTLRANNTNTSTLINSFSTTFNSILKSTTNGTTIYGQINNGTIAASITASGMNSASANINVAGDTTYTFQLTETPPAPPSPTPASPESTAITIIISLFAIVVLLGAGIYQFLSPNAQKIVYEYAAWIVGAIAVVAVIMILASL